MKPWKSYEGYEERLPNHVFIQRVAKAAGVSNQSVHRMAKKRLEKEGKRDRKRLEGCPYTFVSLDLWDTYMQIGNVERVPSKPKGWVTAKSLLEDGFSKRKLYQFVKDGDISAVYVGNSLYLNPESAKGYLQSRQNLRPPPGWISELRQRAGRSKQAIFTYLKRHDIATKQFLHPKRDQLVQYLTQDDADTYLASIQSSAPHLSAPHQEVTEARDQTVEQPANTCDLSGYTPDVAETQFHSEERLAAEHGHPRFMLPGYSYTHSGSLPYPHAESVQKCARYEDVAW
jgi:hypothetical protein